MNYNNPHTIRRLRPSISERACYLQSERHGITTVAIQTADLTEAELQAILEYRLVQYIRAGATSAAYAAEQKLEHEPLENVSAGDMHYIAFDREGMILCYLSLIPYEQPLPDRTLRHTFRHPTPQEPWQPVSSLQARGTAHVFSRGTREAPPLSPDVRL